MDLLWQLEIAITLFFQGLGEWLVVPMRFFTFLGQEEFFLVIMPALYWCVDAALGLRIGLMLMLANAVNASAKLLFRGARPYWVDTRVRAYLSESSFGAPSGHAETAASVWGLLATSVRRRWLQALLVFIIFAIGVSRIYLGVHFTSDVLLGWTIGALTVVLFLILEKPLWNWLKRQQLGQQCLAALFFALLLIAISLLPLLWLGGWEMPPGWSANAARAFPGNPIDPLNPQGAFTIGGTLFGMASGAAWLYRRKGGLDTSGPLQQRVFRYLFGFAGMIALYAGLGAIFPRDPSLLSYTLRFLRYTLIGLWVSALAPVLFVQLGLARPIQPQVGVEMAEKRI